MVEKSKFKLNVDLEEFSKKQMDATVESIKFLTGATIRLIEAMSPFSRELISISRGFALLPRQTKLVTSGIVALGAALSQAINYASEGEQLAGLSRQARLTTDKFQSLSNAAKKYGGTAGVVAQSMSILGDNLADLKNGGDGNGLRETLDSFNINPAGIKSSEQFFYFISAKMGTLKTETAKIDLGRALGLDDATIQVLMGGLQKYNEELSNSSKYNVFSQEDLERSKELQEVLQNIGLGFKVVGNVISELLLPVIIPVFKAIQKVTDFFAENVEMLKLYILEIVGAIGTALIPTIVGIGSALLNLIPVAISLIASMFPIFVIIAGVIALNYALGQLWAWISGKPSIFGKWLGSFETFKEGIINGFKQIKHKIETILKNIWDSIPEPLKFILKNLTVPGVIIQGAIAVAEHVKEHQERQKQKDSSAAAGLAYVPYDGYMVELHKGESVLTKGESNVWRDILLGKQAIASTSNIPLASVPQGAIASAYNTSTTTKNFTIGDITIQTQATDAEGIANDLIQNIKMAFNGLDTGVRA